MLSSIKVHFQDDENGLQPIIAVKLQDSDDPRDDLLKSFFLALGGKSSWVEVSFDHHTISSERDATTYITMKPVRSNQIPDLIQTCHDRILTDTNGPTPINFNPIKKRYHWAKENMACRLSISTNNE